MKLPWIRLPTLVGLGTSTPTSNPSMASPRRMLLDASITKPMSVAPVATPPPSMMTRTWALLPDRAASVFGTEVMFVGVSGTPPDGGRLGDDARSGASGQIVGWYQVRNRPTTA